MSRKVLFLTLVVCALASQSAFADSDVGFKRLGATVGLVSPEEMDTAFGFGVLVDLGTITPQIRLEPRVDYWSKSEEAFGAGVSVRDVTVGARAKYFFEVSNPKFRPFAGAGLGLHLLRAEVEIYDPYNGGTMTVEDSSNKLGVDFGGGVVSPINARTSFLGEVWYGVVSDFSQFHLRVGLTHAFGS